MGKDKYEKEDEKMILMAKMYTGEYIEQNIGHEIINFFKPDNDDYFYGYIIYNGKVKNCDKINTILLVSSVKDKKIEILAKIKDPEFISNIENTHEMQKQYIREKNIRYGNVLLDEIMNANGLDEYGIYITYRTKKIEKPASKQYILLEDSKEESNQEKLSCNMGHNCRYISNKENQDVYKQLIERMEQIDWDTIEEKRITENIIYEYSYTTEKDTFMELINRKYDETVYSNMLYYYFYEKKLFKDFAKNLLKLELSNNIKIYREKSIYKEKTMNSDNKKGRIDIFIEDPINKICIVIENKLKSGINGKDCSKDYEKKGISQLSKYKEWVENTYKGYKYYFYIFVPNYKENELKKDIEVNDLMPKDANNNDLYKIIRYKEIFEYFNSEELKKKMCYDTYYKDFVNALSYHIYTAEKEMERKFVSAIRKVRDKKNGTI